MENKDNYKSFHFESTALYKEKASKFFAYAFPIDSTEEVTEHLKYLKKEHIKARHFCYAFVIGINKETYRANDDGEPSGTAGKPILGQIEKHDLTNALIVVVRYFGGTKLGVSGLIKAYKSAAAMAIENNEIIEKYLTDHIHILCDYEKIGTLQNIISRLQLKLKGINYDENVNIKIEIRSSQCQYIITQIKSLLLERSIEDIDDDTAVEGVEFNII